MEQRKDNARIEARIYKSHQRETKDETVREKLCLAQRARSPESRKNSNAALKNYILNYGSAFKGKSHTKDTIERNRFNQKRIEVDQYDREGNYIQTFSSIRMAAQTTGKDASSISRDIKKGLMQANGWILVPHVANPPLFIKLPRLPLRRGGYKIQQINLEDEQIIWIYETQSAAAREMGVLPSRINWACKKTDRIVKGYKWRIVYECSEIQ